MERNVKFYFQVKNSFFSTNMRPEKLGLIAVPMKQSILVAYNPTIWHGYKMVMW